jgi:hypothetical protein
MDSSETNPSTHVLPAFSSKRFAPAVGHTFTWRAFDATGGEVFIDMKLAELSMGRSPAFCEQYSMLFVGPAEPMLAQGSYRISNTLTGVEDVFAVPAGPDVLGFHQYVVSVARDLESSERDAAANAPT